MNIKSIIKQEAFKRHILVEKLNASEELKSFLQRFRKNYIACDLIRIGGDGDGGYLIPDDFDDVSYCFSPGVDYTAKFEHELSLSYGIKSFMADASVVASPISDSNLVFIQKFLGSRTHDNFITLSDWVEQSLDGDPGKRILQMDIEGAEYDVLTYESSETLSNFSSMIIEFHGLHRLFDESFLRVFSAIFEKIYCNFAICHVHANNCCGTVTLDGVEVPRVVEVSFIRNDFLEKFANGKDVRLPHKLDRKNVENKEDIIMPELWWKDA